MSITASKLSELGALSAQERAEALCLRSIAGMAKDGRTITVTAVDAEGKPVRVNTRAGFRLGVRPETIPAKEAIAFLFPWQVAEQEAETVAEAEATEPKKKRNR